MSYRDFQVEVEIADHIRVDRLFAVCGANDKEPVFVVLGLNLLLFELLNELEKRADDSFIAFVDVFEFEEEVKLEKMNPINQPLSTTGIRLFIFNSLI